MTAVPARAGEDPGLSARGRRLGQARQVLRSPRWLARPVALGGRTGRMTGWGVVALVVAALATAQALGAVAVFAWHGEQPRSLSLWLMDVLSAVVYGAVTLAMLPRTRHAAAWIIVLVALGCGFSALATQLLLLEPRPYGEGRQLFALLTYASWMPGTYATLAVLPWLVGRRTRLTRAASRVGVVLTAVCVLTLLTSPYPGNPLHVTWTPWAEVVAALKTHPDRACVVLSALGTLHLARQWWRARGTELTGYGWLAIGQLLMTAAFVPVSWFVLGDTALDLSGIGLILAQAFLPVALLVVVLRQQLWGVDLAVSRVTVWGLLTLAVLTAYAVLAWLAGMLVPDSAGWAGFVVVGLVVALSQPLRFWIQDRVDRLVYGAQADPVRLLGNLGRDLGEGATSLDTLVEALRQGLRLGGAEVWSADGRLRARSRQVPQPELVLPLVVDGRLLGRLAVAAPPGERIDPRTVRLVDQMAGVLAVALELSQVNERLRAATDRVVEVRHEERRMIRRDLHDGMGPALAGVGLGLAAAQRRLGHDPEGTARLLAELEREVERRTEDVRLLARALLPVQLDEGDLTQALEVLADRFRTSGLVVEVDTTGLGPLDTRRQVAVYHVAAEALMNAYRHAQATSVRIRVATRDGAAAVLEVLDDGEGLAAGRQAGVGLRSMRERAAELGGRLDVEARADLPGTHVTMVLP